MLYEVITLTFEYVNPGSLLLIPLSIGIIVYGAGTREGEITGGSVLRYLFWLVIMAFLYYIMEVLIRCVSFFLISTARMEQIEEAGLMLCFKLPGIAMYGIYKVIFYFILPYRITSYNVCYTKLLRVDVTPGHDRPGDLEGSNTLGNGTAIKISDTSVICDEALNELMFALCKENNIPYQKEVIYVA